MPVVTRITTQKRNSERFNIYWNSGQGEEYGFSLDQDAIIRYQIKKGTTLGEQEVKEILQYDSFKKGLNKAIKYLSYRMRSEHELITYLNKNEYDPTTCKKIMQKLKEYGYINDLEFANMFVRNRIQTSSKGPGVIQQELIQKGVSKDIVYQALTIYTKEIQIEKASKFLEKKKHNRKKQSILQVKQKLSNSLIAKGFNWEIVQIALEAIDFDEELEEQWDALQYNAEKLHRKYKKYDQQKYNYKMKQALYQKGFSMQHIEKWLNNETILDD